MHVCMYRYMCICMHFACIGTCVYADVCAQVYICMYVSRGLMLASGVILIHSLVYILRQNLLPNLEPAVPTDLTSEYALGTTIHPVLTVGNLTHRTISLVLMSIPY